MRLDQILNTVRARQEVLARMAGSPHLTAAEFTGVHSEWLRLQRLANRIITNRR